MCDSKKVVALGFFDGVHLGHAALLNRARAVAEELDIEPAVLTFDRHPDELVSGKAMALINSAEDREYIVSRWFGIGKVRPPIPVVVAVDGIDIVVCCVAAERGD